jgi:hypothetical protein
MWQRLIRTPIPGQYSAGNVFAGVALTAFCGAIAVAGNSENILRSSFDQAIRKSAQTTVAQASRIPVSGSEEFWLTALTSDGTNDGGHPVSKSVTIGDRISMTLGGVEKNLEVASVSEFDPKTTEIDTRARSVRLVLVTARDTSDDRARPVRFVMEIETTPEPTMTEIPAKTL